MDRRPDWLFVLREKHNSYALLRGTLAAHLATLEVDGCANRDQCFGDSG